MKSYPAYLILLLFLFPTLFGSCQEDEFSPQGSRTGSVTLVLPGVLTRAQGDDSTDDSEDALIGIENGGALEGSVNPALGLWFFAFPQEVNGQTSGTMFRKNILDDLETGQVEGHAGLHKLFQFNLEHGTYRFYLAGNIPGLEGVYTENGLKGVLLSYLAAESGKGIAWNASDSPALAPGNLPMYREGIEVTVDKEMGDKNIDMHMTFLCAKVSLYLLKKATDTGETSLTGLQLRHVAGTSLTDATACQAHTPQHFLGNGTDNAIPVTIQGAGEKEKKTITATEVTDSSTPDACFYLPEYYPGDNSSTEDKTLLDITVNGTTTYTLPLGGGAYESTTLPNVTGGPLKRGTHYQITATLPESGQEAELTVNLFKWNTETVEVSFQQTELWVSDTAPRVHIVPFIGSEIECRTNAEELKTECPQTFFINGKDVPLLVCDQGEADAKRVRKLTFRLNPAIPYNTFDNLSEEQLKAIGLERKPVEGYGTYYTGTINMALTANNLTKVVDLTVSIYQMFEVTPTHVTLTEAGSATENYQSYICKTNMGDIELVKTDDENEENGKYQTSIIENADGTREIRIWTGQTITNTQQYSFVVQVKNKPEVSENLSVTLLNSDSYIIHFASINSFLKAESSSTLAFCDGWNGEFNVNNNSDTYYPQTWVSRENFMKAANSNFNLSDSDDGIKIDDKPCYTWTYKTQISTGGNWQDNGTWADNMHLWKDFVLKEVTPGVTEISFNGRKHEEPNGGSGNNEFPSNGNRWNGKVVYRMNINGANNTIRAITDSPMRYPYYHGTLRMFDYDSHEGWVVADPTVIKAAFVGSRPEIVTVRYIVDVDCSNVPDIQPNSLRWYLEYGQVSNDDGTEKNGTFLIQSEPDTNGAYQKIKAKDIGNNRYRFTFDLESVKENTAKDIKILIRTNSGTLECGTLFNGEDYQNGTLSGMYNPATGENDGVGLVAIGKYVPNSLSTGDGHTELTGHWYKGGLVSANTEGTEVTTNADFKIENLATNSSEFRIYFRRPLEPLSWKDSNVKINIGSEHGWNDKTRTMQPYQNTGWDYVDTGENQDFQWYNTNYDDVLKIKNEEGTKWFIATFANKFWNTNDQVSNDGASTGYIYKSDCWAWASDSNNYYPDFPVWNGKKEPSKGRVIGNGQALYYMDRKAFINRPR